ncbi:MAG: sigma-70 family RNA polymerase sigma factor [bacterium]|nr:sigma-70 family RNA polymerase sigma factor [bacterium]
MGDRAALEQLVARYQRKLLGHAYRLLGDTESARDAVQDGWVDILRGLFKLQDVEAFSVWAFRIITRKYTRHIARLRKKRKVLKKMKVEPETASTTSDDIEQVLDHRILRIALAKHFDGMIRIFSRMSIKNPTASQIKITKILRVSSRAHILECRHGNGRRGFIRKVLNRPADWQADFGCPESGLYLSDVLIPVRQRFRHGPGNDSLQFGRNPAIYFRQERRLIVQYSVN